MSNVRALPGIKIDESPALVPDALIVEALKLLLSQAEAGTLTDFCCATLDVEGEVAIQIFCTAHNYYPMFGAIAELTHMFPGAFYDEI